MCNSCVIENVKQNMLSRRLLFKGAVAGVTAMAAGSLAAPVLAQSPRQVVDLTHTYDSTFPTFDGKPGIEMEWAADIAKSGY
ncbi:cyclase family protein, partial [Mesorhizobium sp. M8A.F.Ca.ET.182.01.1.1]